VKPDSRFIALSACDPLNLAGILSPGHRVPSVIRNRLVIHNGMPIASMENGLVVELANVSAEIMEQAKIALSIPISQTNYSLDHQDIVAV